MRGLDDRELVLLERAVRRANGESLDLQTSLEPARETIVERGLAVIALAPCFDSPTGNAMAPVATAAGRRELRLERLIRSGGALKGAA